MHNYGRRLAQKAVHGRKIKVFPPIVYRRPAKDHLRNVLGAHKIRYGIRHAFSFQANHLGAQAFRKSQVGSQRIRIGLAGAEAELPVHVNDVQLSIHASRHSRAASNEILARGIRGNAHGHAFPHSPIFPDILRLHVGFEAAVHLLGDLPQR